MRGLNTDLCRCPKCGKKPEIIFNEGEFERRYIVKCTDEECRYNISGHGLIKSAAREMWNQKAATTLTIANKLINLA